MENETSRTCRDCGETKAIEEFPKQRKWRIRRCRSCENERVRKWQEDRTAQLRGSRRYARIKESTCARCLATKPKEEFPRRVNRGVGIDTYCRECRRLMAAERRANNPEQTRGYDRARSCKKRGVTLAEFHEQLERQRGRCAICDVKVNEKLCIDHCHKTGAFRGLLCHRCNLCIGRFEDNPALLRAAADYLEKSVT